jgi:hypothetical protein
MIRTLLVLGLLAATPTAPVLASQGDEAGMARKDVRAGNVLRLRDIERRVLPMMGGDQYLGPEYDPAAYTYRLKFIRDGRVLFVDVDARTGDVLRQSR